MPLSRDNVKRIRKNYREIVTGIQSNALQSFIDELYSQYYLTGDDKERINAAITSSDKVRIFLDMLITGPAKGYAKFIELLKNDEAYTDLAERIEKTDISEEDNEPDDVGSWIGVDDLKEKKNKQVKDIDLLNFSKAISPQHFSNVGTRLGLDQVTLQNIEYKYNRAAASQELLFIWRNRLGNKATVGRLLEQLFEAFKDYQMSVNRDLIIKALKDMSVQQIETTKEVDVDVILPGIADPVELESLMKQGGTYESFSNRIYLGGACSVGKSTLACLLIGDNIPLEWKSTDGLKIFFGRNGIHLEEKKMVPLDKDPAWTKHKIVSEEEKCS